MCPRLWFVIMILSGPRVVVEEKRPHKRWDSVEVCKLSTGIGHLSLRGFFEAQKREVQTLELRKKNFRCHFISAFLLFGLLMIPEASMVWAAPANPVNTLTFQQARTEFDKLSSSDRTSRESWLKLVRSFRSIHKASKGEDSAAGLFFAGKVLVRSYRAHGNALDLENGIKALNEFKRIQHQGQYKSQALVELKDAHLLKRKIRTGFSSTNVMKPAPQTSANNPNPGNDEKKTERYQIAPVNDLPNPTAHDVSKTEQLSVSSVENRRPITRFGNPYYNLSVQPEKKVAEVKMASLPPKALSDVKPQLRQSEARIQPIVMVLDPGHGGKDPGAVSRDGSLTEKEVTLRIAKRLKKLVEKSVPNVTVKLTRDDDTFLSLKDRTEIANAANADLFVSIHCNGSAYASASGVETFFLSQANSRGAMRAAARENGISLSKMNHLEATLIDLMMTSKRTESAKLAEIIQESLMDDGSQNAVKPRDRGVKQAPFYVLMGATMPAILVECAFISNMSEKNNLKNENHIDSIAKRISLGAKKYLLELGNNS